MWYTDVLCEKEIVVEFRANIVHQINIVVISDLVTKLILNESILLKKIVAMQRMRKKYFKYTKYKSFKYNSS